MNRSASIFLVCLTMAWVTPVHASFDTSLQQILRLSAEGQGNREATPAWREISQSSVDRLPSLFEALDSANPISANYLRSAIEVILERTASESLELPVPLLGEVLLNRNRSTKSRVLAYELLGEYEPELQEQLLPGMLDDPSEPLRRDAVERLLESAKKASEEKKNQKEPVLLLQALNKARDVEQVREISGRLAKLGSPADLPRHFGFLMHWQVIGPFDNTDRKGFTEVYPPEENLDLSLTHPGKLGPVTWKPYVTSDPYGKVDLNQPFGLLKQVCAYALAEFESDTARQVELRLGTKNAWKVWLNGELLFERDEYHRGQRIDQYQMKAELRAGKNQILVKCCQNEQEQDWTVEWEFRLRVCDSSGTAILAQNRPPTPQPEAAKTPSGCELRSNPST